MSEDAKKPLGRILLRQRAVTQPELEKALAGASPGGPPLATRLTEAGTISEVAALKALSEQSGVPGIDLNQVCIKLSDLAIVPKEIAVRHKLLPVLVRDDRIFVAMTAPDEKKVIDEIEFVTGKKVFPYIALAGPLMRAINTAYEMRDRGEDFYVGPHCPPEVQRRAGVPNVAPAPVPAPRPSPEPPPPPPARTGIPVAAGLGRSFSIGRATPVPGEGAPGDRKSPVPRGSDDSVVFRLGAAQITAQSSTVIVDDAMGKIPSVGGLADADFGLADRDLSVMARLPNASGAGPAPREGQRTVLIVDDEEEIRRLLRITFQERGYRVVEADRGLLALSLIKEHPPDVVILDAMLPEVHGFDIAKRLKGAERYAHIPIVMVSAVYRGWRYAEDVKASYGVDAYIEKPFRIADVVRAVENALAHPSSRADDEQISAEAEKLLHAGIDAYRKGDIDRAIEHLREGTRIDALAYRLHYHLGLLYGKKGQIYDAIQELQTALEINGRHFPALKNLAVLYQQAGFRNKAIETWERALAAAPDEPTRQSIKEHLVGLL